MRQPPENISEYATFADCGILQAFSKIEKSSVSNTLVGNGSVYVGERVVVRHLRNHPVTGLTIHTREEMRSKVLYRVEVDILPALQDRRNHDAASLYHNRSMDGEIGEV